LRRDRNRVWSALLYIPELQAGGFNNGSIALIMRGGKRRKELEDLRRRDRNTM
jgi:hypothetical protein